MLSDAVAGRPRARPSPARPAWVGRRFAAEGRGCVPVADRCEGRACVPLPGRCEGRACVPLPGRCEGRACVPLPGRCEGRAWVPVRAAFLADAAGSVAGGVLGTSTVTSYVESAAGVASGGRTGLAAVSTAVLFLASLFFSPLLQVLGGSFDGGPGVTLYPTLAPALVLVGVFMTASVGKIRWSDPLHAIPSFLTIFMMPLTTSITEGIAFGFVSTSLLYVVSGRGREPHWLAHAVAAAFLARFIWL